MSNMTQTSTETSKATLFARTTTATLVESALMLELAGNLSEEERIARAWTLDEIERRHPEITAAIDAWVESMDETRTYAGVVADALTEAGVI